MHKPSWYSDGQVLVVNAKTCGINKDGHEQYIVNPETGIRSNETINDQLAEACDEISKGSFSRDDVSFRSQSEIFMLDVFVPKYYDASVYKGINSLVEDNGEFTLKTLGELVEEGKIYVFGGHGSPSSDQRVGTIPYIKVSDLRAGLVNINPTNMIPEALAKVFWRGGESKLKPYDLISPERASKNIGEFCVLMPGQERVVLTKEVIIVRACEGTAIDQFYLMWALSLKEVREQWERIIFMQTNREDVGKRVLEISIPYPNDKIVAAKYAEPFKKYFESLEAARKIFMKSLDQSSFNHFIHWGEMEVEPKENAESGEEG
ncbi:restriction endonuclease subunit S domain-containing protein [Rufibacter roseus]|uniref:Type I restriction modification DNA specificity domain-containing protein n=1 Tax=Rufibacter roseus TaxID=1567108 RepID=A0ABW2DEX3_9BACT|nr:hypothetical protein [Rufibacter roseus]